MLIVLNGRVAFSPTSPQKVVKSVPTKMHRVLN